MSGAASGIQTETAKPRARNAKALSSVAREVTLRTGIQHAVSQAGPTLDAAGALRLTRAYFPELAGAKRPHRRAGHPLTVTPPEDPNGPLVVSTQGLTFQIHRVGAPWPTAPSPDARFDSPSHLLAPAGAWSAEGPSWVTSRVDEYAIQSPGKPYAAAYAVALPAEVTRIHDAGGYLELWTRRMPVLRFEGAVARDAMGTTRTGRFEVAGLAPGGWAPVRGTLHLSTSVETEGLAGPVVVDPGWSETGSLFTPREHATATLLPSGKVLVVGGFSWGSPVGGGELYDPATGTWAGAAALATARGAATATLLPSGKVLVAGGANENGYLATGTYQASAELYDPAAGTWSPTGAMASARRSATATLLPTGKVLVTGGYAASGFQASAELYDPATGTWSPTGSLAAAREFATATLLPSGKVLVAGGRGSSYLTSSELYDPATGTWSPTGSMLFSRYQATATLLPSGQVLVTGGFGDSGNLSWAELYDPTSGTWNQTGTMATARKLATATLLPSGKVLVAGGDLSSDPTHVAAAELYDPAYGTWSSAGALRVTGVVDDNSVLAATATLLPSGEVLFAGGHGYGGPTGYTGYLEASERYDPAAGASSATGALNTARDQDSATLLPSGKVLIAGGYSGADLGSAELYDPAAGTWSATGALASARYQATATLLQAGKVLVVGGHGSSGHLASAELYDPASGTWSATRALISARAQATATLLPSGKVLVVGGENASAVLASAELYDPVSGTWSATGALATARKSATATLLPSGKVLVAGGHGWSTNAFFASAELYDPASGTWSATGSMTTAREFATATLLPSGKVLIVGGNDSIQYLASAELYDPATGTWSATGSLSTARWHATATLLRSGKVLVAGGFGPPFEPLASAEVYDPLAGTWSAAGALVTARELATATLLPSGKVLIAGGEDSSGLLASAELYDDTASADVWRPVVASTGALQVGLSHTFSGSRFRGVSGASGGAANDSSTDFPFVTLEGIENNSLWVLPSRSFSATTATVDVPVDVPSGHYILGVTANAIKGGTVVSVAGDLAPWASDQTVSLAANGSLGITLTATDGESDPLTYSVVTPPANGILSGTAPNLTYAPAANYHGPDTFTFQANDGHRDSNNATVSLSVTDTAPR
jgi:hypothetical protein